MLATAGTVDLVLGFASLVGSLTAPVYFPDLPLFVVILASGAVIVVASLELVGGWAAATDRSRTAGLTCAVLGIFVLVTVPLDILAAVLLSLDEVTAVR